MHNRNIEIPKRIFYCWFGGEIPQKVTACIDTWKEKMPEYQIIRIGEDDNPYFNLKEECRNNLWLDTCYKRKMWAYVADYARLKVLYDFGGIYFDTDITVKKSLDPLVQKNKLVLAWESINDVNGAVIIVPKQNTIIKGILDFYTTEIWHSELYILPQIVTSILKNNFDLNSSTQITENSDVLILTPEYFYPLPFGEECTNVNQYITNNSYTVHWWNASWCTSEIQFFLDNKHLIPLDKIDEEYKKSLNNLEPNKKNNFIQNIFSVKNSSNRKYKIVTIFGIKLKYKRKNA